MADETLSTRLQKIWDIFFHAETGTYEKSLWLDLLLAEFLIQLKEGTDISQILSFCPLGGVTTLIGCELLCGIHCVTSVYGHCTKKSDCTTNCENKHFSPTLTYDGDVEIPKEETAGHSPFCDNLQQAPNFPSLSHVDQSLHKYVLKGAAWRCLALLQILGVKGLSCRRQLSRTLIWLYGELCGVTSTSCEPNPFLSAFESKLSIHELFSNKIWSQRKNFMFNALYSKDNSTIKRSKKTANGTPSSRKRLQRTPRSKAKDTTMKKSQKNLSQFNNSHSSDSQDFDDLERMNRSFALKLKCNPTDVDYFTSAAYTDGDILDSPRNCLHTNVTGDKKSIKRFKTNKHAEILNSEISVYEFNMLVIDLLYQLCMAEADVSGSEALPINVQCITFTIKHLCTLQFESSPAASFSMDSNQVANLKASLTELLMISLNKVLMHPDLFGKIISNGMLPMLLRLLEDMTYKLTIQLNVEDVDENSAPQFKDKYFTKRSLNDSEVNHILKYLFGITYSVLIFLYSLMMQRRTLNNLKDFTDQFKLFSDCKKGLLINESINIMLRLPGVDKGYVPLLVKKIIVLLGRFIVAMKQVRCAVTHLANCARMKHKWCYSKLIVTLHHHQDVLSTNCPSNQNTILSSGCCVTILYGVLTSLLSDRHYTSNIMLLTKLLKCMINSGSCCCFSPQFLIDKVINAIIAHPSVSNLGFAALEHTMYGELGAVEYEYDDSNCTVCKRFFNTVNIRPSDSLMQESNLAKYKIVWPFLTKYNTLLYYEDRLLVTATMNHLLKMSSNSNNIVRHDLLFCVLYPVFISAKDQYMSKNNDSSYFVTLSCLNLFSSLLSTITFMEEFIQKGGLMTVLDLIMIEDFFKPCCILLEIAVNIEIFQFEQHDESSIIDVSQLQFLTSPQILFKTLDEIIDKALRYFMLKMDSNTFQSVTDMSKIVEGVPFKNKVFFKKNLSTYAKKTYPINICNTRRLSSASSENESIDNHIEEITKMAVYWKTIASLCLYCPLFRKYFCTCNAFEDSYRFLKLVLYNICYTTTTEVEKNCMIKILESVVTIGLVLSDCTMGDSKKLTIKLLSEDISLDSLNTIESSNLRLLIEVLFKLSTVNVGDEHILCSIKETKLPVTPTTHNYDDFPSSGDDDDQYCPYISEDSDPYHTADEGYEADVDVCRRLSMKRGLSSSDNNINIKPSDTIERNFDKSIAHLKQNFVMYPEVCSVGIRILMKLIERIIKADEECSGDFDASVSLLYDVSCTCIASLTSILSSNCNSSPGFGIIKHFFSNPASKILRMKSDRVKKLQLNISDLIYTLASQNISAPELKRFVNFFTSANAPLDILLKPLEKLAGDISQNIPDYILCFPIEKNDEFKISEYMNNSKIKGSSIIKTKSETVLHKQHFKMGIDSCWSRAAVWCDIDGVNWSLWMQGCSIAMWLRIQDAKSSANKSSELHQFNSSDDATESVASMERQNKYRIFKLNKASEQLKSKTGRDNQVTQLSSYLHMMSIGHENLIVEFWLDTANGNLRIRICRPEAVGNTIMFENEVINFLMMHEWNHLAMNIKEILQNHTIYLQITMFLNGYEKDVVLMPIKGLINRKTKPNYLLLGHSYSNDARNENKGFWYFSGIDLFRAPLFNKNNITYIFANGPNNSSLYRSQIRSSIPNYANLFNESILTANLDWDLVLNTSSSNMKELEEMILLSYSAHNPLYTELYHQMVSNSNVFGAKVKKSSGFPESQMCMWSGLPLSSLHRGITSAVYLIGGPQVFLYLYARIVEIDGTPEEQSSALYVLLKLSFSDSRLYMMFQNDNLFSMMKFVFSMPKCNLTIHTLKVMLDVACSKPIIEKVNKQFYLNVKSNAIVFHPHIIIVLLQIWKKLEDTRVVITEENITEDTQNDKEPDHRVSLDQIDKSLLNNDLLEALFYSMEVVMRESHIYSTFNVYQLNRVNMLEQLLIFCKERFLNHDMKKLSIEASYSLVELIRSLIGNPPLTHHIALIMDFLVLIHKASETYVTHSRPKFYFLLSPMKPPRSESNANILGMKLPFVSKKRGVRQQRKKKHFGSVNSSERSFNVSENETLSYADSDNREANTDCEESFEMISNKAVNNESFSFDENLPSTSADPQQHGRMAMNSAKARKLKKDKKNRRIKSNRSLLSNIETAEAQSSGKSSSIEGYLIVETDNSGNPSIPGESIAIGSNQSIFHNLKGGSVHSQIVCEGLLLLIRDTVCILPDTLLNQVLGVVLHNETLLILGNHEEPSIRAAVVKLIAAIIQRSSLDELKQLEQSHFFYHLANQISQYPASSDLVAACASLVTECRASLQQQLEDEIWNDVSEFSIQRACPLVSLLTCTFHDYPLMRNVIVLLRKIIDKGNTKTLEDISLCEVVLKSLQKFDFVDDKMLIQNQCIYELYTLLSLVNLKHIVCSSNSQIVTDIYNQITFLELTYKRKLNNSLAQVIIEMLRNAQCFIMTSELDFMEEKLKTEPSSSILKNIEIINLSYKTSAEKNLKQKQYKLSRSGLQSRYGIILAKASSFLLNRDLSLEMSNHEQSFVKKIFTTLINFSSDISKRIRQKWHGISDTNCLKYLSDLFVWLISPLLSQLSLQLFVLNAIYVAKLNLKQLLTPNDPSYQRKIAVYLTIMEKNISDENIKNYISEWIENLHQGQYMSAEGLTEEADHLMYQDFENVTQARNEMYPALNRCVFSKEVHANKITETAMTLTRTVVETQNIERKAFLDHLRHQQITLVNNAQKWRDMINRFSHERGIWYFESSYPQSWEVNPIEGPDRVRIRLKRCALDIKESFFQEGKKHLSNRSPSSEPLSYLFDSFQTNIQSGLLGRSNINESIVYMARATYVTLKCEESGELLLGDRSLHFSSFIENGRNCIISASWALDSIVGIVTRRWQLRERAIELFLLSGHPQFIAFESTSDMEAFMVALNGVTLPNRQEEDTLSESMNHWRTGGITNWKYLMQLNGCAGRTYNDLMQYPVMPFILSDYVSDKLDLNKSTSFRDLKKPMAVQNKQKETHFINNYNYLKQARKDGTSLLFNINKEPYHYGSHYSNSGTVLHFLVRVPPYTILFLNYQDNNFDMPDRTFHSLQTTWRLTSSESTTDVKELIPEFFYLPEFLRNLEGLNFGIQQSGVEVNDVILPPWAPNSRIFVLIHRQALESSYVRENLPHWIDLVFGYKQTGQAAVEAVNVFHPATYYGFDPGTITDEIVRNAWETMVRTYGQTPRQLFKNSHSHCITDLGHLPENIMEVLPSVRGLRWGKYCGSPEEPIPTIIWQRHQSIPPQKLIPLPNNEVIGVPNQTTLTITYSKNRGSSLLGNDLVGCIGLVTWGHPDGIIRIKHKKELPFEPLFMIDRIDPLTVISHDVGDTTGILWIGLQSGNIIVVSVGLAKYTSLVPKLYKETVYLYGHTSPIVSICVCNSFGVAASASQSGSVIIWDTQSLTYVRNIPNIYSTISNICISETLGDIATIHILPNVKSKKISTDNSNSEEPKASDSTPINTPVYKSAIRVHTINGSFVGEVKIQEKVTSACYSNAPEGISVNALVVGTHNGTIKLFSSWDLKLLLVLNPPCFTQPIISIVYSQNSQYLYAAATDGTITIWGDANTSETMPTFRMLTSHAIF